MGLFVCALSVIIAFVRQVRGGDEGEQARQIGRWFYMTMEEELRLSGEVEWTYQELYHLKEGAVLKLRESYEGFDEL